MKPLPEQTFIWLRKAALLLLLVVLGVSVARALLYAADDYLGSRLGFDLASAVGVAPFIAILIYLAIRFPRARG